MFGYAKCDTHEFFDTADRIIDRYSEMGFKLKRSCVCRSESSPETKMRVGKSCVRHQTADEPHVPEKGVYSEAVKCLHFERNGKGVIVTIEGYIDETETFAYGIWEKTYGKKLPKSADRRLEISAIRCFAYGFENGRPFTDFNCTPRKENNGAVKLFTNKKRSWMEKLKVPRNAVIIRNDKPMIL